MDPTINKLYDFFLKFPVITTDSRNIPGNSIFFALKGESFNGNDFALEALEKGARLAVVDDPQFKSTEGCFLVKDVLSALQNMALLHRENMEFNMIAITGSNGKTTTKELIQRVLKQKFNSKATKGNLNNHIGVPLTMLSMTKEVDMAVVEMGANHIGEIAQLCEIARPDYGLITNIGKAHLEGFGSIEGVRMAKTELYKFIQSNNGKIFLNADNEILVEESRDIDSIAYGSGKMADFKGSITKSFPYLSVEFSYQDKKYNIKSKLPGKYNFENIMAAICVGLHFEVPAIDIVKAIESYQSSNNRSQIIETEDNFVILDAYNANPTSMRAAIENFQSDDYTNKVMVLGDMMELGMDSAKEHQELIENLKSKGFENVYLVGDCFMKTKDIHDYHCFKSNEELLEHLYKKPLRGCSLLIKGSRKMKLEDIVSAL
jgi:UDP-N-acetylmuramoyl-tripeptide--D-alanyl-D-alanine ligase